MVQQLYRRSVALIALSGMLAGCYTQQPVSAVSPVPGEEIALDINDVGRVGLGPQAGTGVSQIRGRLVRREAANYVLAVTSVRTLDGGEQVWKGEELRINPDYVSVVYDRKFSTVKTVVVIGVGIAAFVLLVTRGLAGGGTEDPIPGQPGGSAIRIP